MSEHAREVAAKGAEQGGAALAVGSGLMKWLGENHDAIASIGVIAGVLIGALGFFVNWYFNHQRYLHDLRMKERRGEHP